MKRLRYFWCLIGHFITSNSRHGTHSPFVYALAADVVYKRQNKKYENKHVANRLVNEIADYLRVSCTFSQGEVGPDNALCVENVVTTVDELAELQHQFQYIVLFGIYNGTDNINRWGKVCRDERFVVTIDFFFFGLIFYRTEQPKQHFKLRFPFWKYWFFP